jgi:hypothetical protein
MSIWNFFKKKTFTTDSKSKGEAIVNHIAFTTFLKYWCYPNPLDITKDNKEICDLLIVFDDVCIIVSVKNYSFSGDYKKYFRKTVDKALRQIGGAERRLFGTRDILLKHPDRPSELFPKEKIKSILRIIVNTNTSVKYYYSSVCTDNNEYITIYDAEAWESLLTELDTISDFVQYLKEKERLFRKRPAIILPRKEYDFPQAIFTRNGSIEIGKWTCFSSGI